MKKKGDIELDKLGMIILAIVLLAVIIFIIIILKGKGINLIDKLKELILYK